MPTPAFHRPTTAPRSPRRRSNRFVFAVIFWTVACTLGGCGGSATPDRATPGVDGQQVEFTVSGVRPEAYSWFWNNQTADLLQQANADIQAFRWTVEPTGREHLGYDKGASYELVATIDGATRAVTATYMDPVDVRDRVGSDNFLGNRPHDFLALAVRVDQEPPVRVLISYTATGERYTDTAFKIDVDTAAPTPAVASTVALLRKTLEGAGDFLMSRFDSDYLNGVLLSRGTYRVTPVDPATGMFRVVVTQDIRGIAPEMLAWWWDHIGNLERYRLWQPVDHDGFAYDIAPSMPDLQYDFGARQVIREYIGSSLFTLGVEGADPAVHEPPAPLVEPQPHFFNSLTTLISVQQVHGVPLPFDVPADVLPLPPNQLLHQWRWNASGDAVTLETTFTLPAFVMAVQPSFGDDLGRHALREFQMMPYFLPRLFKREWLGQ